MVEEQLFPHSTGTGMPSIAGAMVNSTSYLRLPTPKDLFNFPVRFARGARRFATRVLPTDLGGLNASLDSGAADMAAVEVADIAQAAAGSSMQGMARHPETIWEAWRIAFNDVFGWNNIRSFGGMLHYMTSRWAFGAFVLVSRKWSFPSTAVDMLIRPVFNTQPSRRLRRIKATNTSHVGKEADLANNSHPAVHLPDIPHITSVEMPDMQQLFCIPSWCNGRIQLSRPGHRRWILVQIELDDAILGI